MTPDRTWTYEDAVAAIAARLDKPSGMTASPDQPRHPSVALERMHDLMRLAGLSPSFRIIHVAGSIGKGSTCAMLESMLRAAGYRTGLFTSPHLHTLQERIAINGEAISPTRFTILTAAAEAVATECESRGIDRSRVSAFELLTVMALTAFQEEKCDVAVIEVGLGGLYDPTNVVDPTVSVITRIDFEHTAILGNTLADIARNKAGIVKPGRPVVSHEQERTVSRVIEQVANSKGCELLTGGIDFRVEGSTDNFSAVGPWGAIEDLQLRMSGDHQMQNAATAIAAVRGFPAAGFAVSDKQVRQGLASAWVPGRFELMEKHGRTFILDVAHTPASAMALRESLRHSNYAKPIWVVGMLTGRDPAAFLNALLNPDDFIVLTATDHPRSVSAAALESSLPSGIAAESTATLETALSRAAEIGSDEQPVVVTGSVELVARAIDLLATAE